MCTVFNIPSHIILIMTWLDLKLVDLHSQGRLISSIKSPISTANTKTIPSTIPIGKNVQAKSEQQCMQGSYLIKN